jgi:ABC-2 type transport system ATP-binding protein
MIVVKDVSLILNKYTILDHVNIEAKQGEAVGLVGGNGSGKTMLMKCICGFITTFTGEIFVNKQQIGKDVEFPPKTSFIIETPGFIPYMTGFENLKVLAGIKNEIHNKEIREVMELVELDPDSKKSVKKYSLGMKQRLGIAQAIMENPDILILDEPFNGLDRQMAAKIRQVLIEERNKGKTILLVSHNEKDILDICDRSYYIDGGKII